MSLFYDSPDLVGLSPQGCDVGNGALNCTAACSDPSMTFKDLANFRNCLMYPAVADMYAIGQLTTPDAVFGDSLAIVKSGRASERLRC